MSDNSEIPPSTQTPEGQIALLELLEERRPSLTAFVERRLGGTVRGKVETQDILQEVAIRALRGSPPEGDAFGWLCRLAEQCIIDTARHFSADKRDVDREQSGKRTPEGDRDLIALIAASLTTPSQAAVRSERQRRLDDALAVLPEEHRETLQLRYAEGLSTGEIATRLNKTDVAVRVMLTRIIQKLRDLLDPAEES